VEGHLPNELSSDFEIELGSFLARNWTGFPINNAAPLYTADSLYHDVSENPRTVNPRMV